MEGKPVTLDDVHKAQAGRTMDEIPMNDPYWEIVNQYRLQEVLMSETKDTPKHEDVNDEALAQVVEEEEEDFDDDEEGDDSDDDSDDEEDQSDIDDQFKL